MAALGVIILALIGTLAYCMPQLHLHEITVAAGDKLLLQCALENENKNVIIWKKGDRVLFAGSIRVRHDERISVNENVLSINVAEPEDEGEYRCEIEDSQGQFKVFAQKVVILQAPIVKISQVGTYLAVKQGTNLALNCVGSGVPLPEIRWRRGSKILSRGLGEAGVLLEYVTREDAGDIVCEASNGVGDAAVDTLLLDVLYAPEVDMMEPHLSFQPKCGLELQCVIHSSSIPSVEWMHNDMLLDPKEGVTMWSLENLHVLQLSRCDYSILGQFSCKAENNLGQEESSVTITKQWIEDKISEMLAEEDSDSNNVRRNVENVETALPLVSSSSKYFLSMMLLISSVTLSSLFM